MTVYDPASGLPNLNGTAPLKAPDGVPEKSNPVGPPHPPGPPTPQTPDPIETLKSTPANTTQPTFEAAAGSPGDPDDLRGDICGWVLKVVPAYIGLYQVGALNMAIELGEPGLYFGDLIAIGIFVGLPALAVFLRQGFWSALALASVAIGHALILIADFASGGPDTGLFDLGLDVAFAAAALYILRLTWLLKKSEG